jgi:Domain of unknown function (DUF4386)
MGMQALNDRTGLKLSGGFLMTAAVLGSVVNGFHPITTGDLEETATTIAGDGEWILLHLGIVVAMLLLAAGLTGMIAHAEGTRGTPIAKVAMVITSIGTALAVVSVAIDGVALKILADEWAAVSPQETPRLFDLFATTKRINTALWGSTVMVFFGFAILCHGTALLQSRRLPPWMGWAAVLSALGSLLAASLQLPAGGESRTGEFIFLGSSILLTIWALTLGYLWWREARSQVIAATTSPKRDPALPGLVP